MPFLSFTCHYILNQLFAGLISLFKMGERKEGHFLFIKQ